MMHKEPLLRPGQLLERRYRLGPLLARGGFGEVYEAQDLQLERRVALKYIFQPLDPAQLQNEVRILATHAERLLFMPNVYAFWPGARGVGFFIVMEFVEGPTLKASRPLPWPAQQVAEFLRILLGNLADLHRHGIIHCDIKPVNIKATPDYQLSISVPYRLLDFGIARQVGQTVISGASPNYSAPEQHGLGVMKIDHRVDLYALGATAYFLLTGHKPADARSRYAAVSRGDQEELRPPASLVPGLLHGLEPTILDLLQLDRDRRPPDAAAALALLEQRLAPPPAVSPADAQPLQGRTELADERSGHTADAAPPTLPTARPATPVSQVSVRPQQTSRAPTIPQERSGESGARTPAPPAAPPVAPRYANLLDRHGAGVITGVAWEPSGEALLVATTLGIYRYTPSDGARQLFHATVSPVQQLGTAQGCTALFCRDNRLWLLPLDGGSEAVAAGIDVGGAKVLSAAQSDTLAIVGDDELRLTSLGDQADELEVEMPARLLGRVAALSADGQVIAFGAGDQVSYLALRGEHQQLGDLPQPLRDLALSSGGAVLAVAGEDSVAVWQADDAVAQLFPHPGAARVALSGDGELLAVADRERVSLRLCYDGRPLPELAASDLPGAHFLALCPHDRLLAAASPNAIRVWRLADYQLTGQLDDFGPSGAWLGGQELPATGGATFVSAGTDLRRWMVEDGRLVIAQTLPLERPASGIAGGGPWLASAEDLGIALRSKVGLEAVSRRPLLSAQHHGMALTPDGRALIIAGASAIIVDATDAPGSGYELPLGDHGEAEHVAFSADGSRAAIHSRRQVVVRALPDGDEVVTVRPRVPGEITALALNQDGTRLVAAIGGVLALWELKDGRARTLWQQAFGGLPAHYLALGDDGAVLVALQGPLATVWRIGDAGIDPQPTLCAHNDRVTDVLLLAAARQLVTASADGAVRLWDLA